MYHHLDINIEENFDFKYVLCNVFTDNLYYYLDSNEVISETLVDITFKILKLNKCVKFRAILNKIFKNDNKYVNGNIINIIGFAYVYDNPINNKIVFEKYIYALSKINIFDYNIFRNALRYICNRCGNNMDIPINEHNVKDILKLRYEVCIIDIIKEYDNLLDDECINLAIENIHYLTLKYLHNKISHDQLLTILNDNKDSKHYINIIKRQIICKYLNDGGKITKDIFDTGFNAFSYACIHKNSPERLEDNRKEFNRFIMKCVDNNYIITQEEFQKYIGYPYVSYTKETIDEILKKSPNLKLTNEVLDNVITNGNIINACIIIEYGVNPTMSNIMDMLSSNENIPYNCIDIFSKFGVDINQNILNRYCKYIDTSNLIEDYNKQLYDVIKKYEIIPCQESIDIICCKIRNN